MKDKELKQKLSRLQSKAWKLQFDLGRLISELDINNQEEIIYQECPKCKVNYAFCDCSGLEENKQEERK